MSVRQTWVVREGSDAASWFDVRLSFADGARLEALAVLSRHGVRVEDVRARPPLSLDDLSVLAEWLEHPLFDACAPAGAAPAASRRARPAWPGGREGRRLVAREYRAAREAGGDPVLAVMRATGHGRRRSLRLIGQARDDGFLTPRRARR
ncbi:DUF6214 family protein [Streptomyces mutabilis]|uniref:DUF6214 family protein n=1 Tax=Streptomyces TaxID=1883 RepID=UPI000A22FAA3|nr:MULTISPECIES: DUF6214 family protein [Streptomyces]OSC72974.1 hypothetical protein B5181_01750 [Streptomyces sp. 4F]MCZ9350430.1 DUF6214 family protein [Streptomyces mutabilis]MDN3245058.1 DUF6214 family protein [Streptomyces sp. ZSW22]MDN3253128.1 DUF6214 family protein [Streptomyces sp. MA25(2023)]MDQ0389269.1 hypothetical protein [Streptomyces sp. DSM 42143]